jgi:DNA polymerase III delta subunit
VATFLQAKRLLDNDELKRAYYLYGPDRILVEEIVDIIRAKVEPHPLDYVSLSAAEVKPRDIWAQLNQYPLDPLHHRLVIVRDAEKISKWDSYLDWINSRLIPQVVAVFIDSRHDVDTTVPHIERTVKSGRLVKCGPLNDDDAIEYLKTISPDILSEDAAYLLERTGGSLYKASYAVRKANLLIEAGAGFKGMPPKLTDRLVENSPSEDFVDALTALDKPRAFTAAQAVDPNDVSMAIGGLDYRLDLLAILNRAVKRQQTIRDIMTSTRVPAFMIKRLYPHVKHYGREEVRARYKVLALVDSQVQQGAREGVLEVLVSLW